MKWMIGSRATLLCLLLTSTHAAFVGRENIFNLREEQTVHLREREWWHGRLDLSTLDTSSSPLAVSVRVKHAERCSEATFADGSCRFGLKVLGSARGPVHFERQAFDSEVPASFAVADKDRTL